VKNIIICRTLRVMRQNRISCDHASSRCPRKNDAQIPNRFLLFLLRCSTNLPIVYYTLQYSATVCMCVHCCVINIIYIHTVISCWMSFWESQPRNHDRAANNKWKKSSGRRKKIQTTYAHIMTTVADLQQQRKPRWWNPRRVTRCRYIVF